MSGQSRGGAAAAVGPLGTALLFGAALGLDQEWSMFAPVPLDLDGWYVAAGRLSDGREIDLLAGGAPLSFAKPRVVSAQYPNDRWRKFLMNLEFDEFEKLRPYYARWICTDWNATHPQERLDRLRLVFIREHTVSAERVAAPRATLLAETSCGPDLALGALDR